MFRRLCAVSTLTLLPACFDKEPGPPVMTLSSETETIEIAANQLRGLSIYGEGLETALGFRMVPDIAKAFSDMTVNNIGKPIVIAICGDIVSQPVVREHIANGSAQITGYSLAEFGVFLKKLDGSEPC